MKKWYFLILVLVIGLAISYNPQAAQAGKVLDLGDCVGGAVAVPQRVALEFFCAEVGKRTNGEITVKYHPATIVSSETKAIEMLRGGALAFCTVGGGTGTVLPNTQYIMLPYLWRDYGHYFRAIRGPIGKKLDDEIERLHKVKVVYWFDWGFRQFVTTKKPINKAEDLKDMKVRVMPSPPLADMINALGASAVPISAAEVIQAVQQGVVDGLDYPVANIIMWKLYEIAKYVAMSYHYFTPTPLLVNLNIWKELTPAQQQIILQVGIEAADKEGKLMGEADAQADSLLGKYGMKVTHPDLNSFRKIAVEKVYPKYYEKFGKNLIEEIINLK